METSTKTSTKTCTQCKTIKNISLFGNDKKMKDALNIYCKSCISDKSKKYNKENKLKRANYYADNKDKLSTKAKIRYMDNGVKDRERAFNYRKNNPDKKREQDKKYRESNQDKIKSYLQTPAMKEYYRVYNQKRRALKMSTANDTINKNL